MNELFKNISEKFNIFIQKVLHQLIPLQELIYFQFQRILQGKFNSLIGFTNTNKFTTSNPFSHTNHFYEEENIKMDDRTFSESIKCHHNDIVHYIKDNYLIDSQCIKDMNDELLNQVLTHFQFFLGFFQNILCLHSILIDISTR